MTEAEDATRAGVYSAVNVEHPTEAWAVIAQDPIEGVCQEVDAEELAPAEQPADTVRFVCVSDTHGREAHMPALPPGDVLIHGGDFTNTGELGMCEAFNEWLGKQPYKHKVVIAGNHETTFDTAAYPRIAPRFHGQRPFNPVTCRATLTNATHYLEDSACVVEGVKIWGSPWSPWFHDWGFNARRGAECDALWQKIPEDTDVLLTHGPPIGHGDLCFGNHRAGCVDLLRHVNRRIRPQYHVFGHIHEGYGATRNAHTTFVNASTCNFRYKPVQPAIVFDVSKKALKSLR